jgi:cell division protein FtsW
MAAATAARSARAQPVAQPLEQRILQTATLCLLAAGAVMVYSASSARTLLQGQGSGGTDYLVKYAIYGGLGMVLAQVLARRGLELVRRATPVILAVAFAGVVAVKIPGLGIEVNGARRWLGVGPVQFQPSELMKFALVLYGARLFAAEPDRTQSLKRLLMPFLVVAGAACALVASEPDLGTALVIAFTVAALMVAAGVPMRYLLLLGGLVAIAVVLFALAEPYRRARLVSFLSPWSDAGGSGFQAVQGQIAIGSGGLFGLGPGQSVQKIFYLPEAHTDFILAVIGEELGVAGISGLLILYGMLAYAGLRAARAARGPYAMLLAAGLTSLILCQAALNLFAVLGLAPLTGVPLPFVSYGSSNLVVLLAAVGLLLNVAGGGTAGGPAPRGRPSDVPTLEARRLARERDGERTDDRDRRRGHGRTRRAGAGGR